MLIRCLISAGYLEPPPGSKAQIGPRAVTCKAEGFPEQNDWIVVMLPNHTVFTKSTPDRMLARCYELYPEIADREKRPTTIEKLADTLAGIQVYYAHINWWPVYCKELADPSWLAKGFEPAFEVEVPDNAPTHVAPEKRIILG